MISFQGEGKALGRFHPVLKLLLLLLVCTAFFVASELPRTLLLLAVVLSMYVLSRVSPLKLGGIRFFISLSLALIFVNIIFIRSGDVLLDLRLISITNDGIASGLQKAALFLGVILSSMLFVATTNTSRLTNSFMQMGVPYRYAYMIVTSMSLAPVFQMEASTVRKAQVARGLQIDSGSVSRIVKMARFTFLPLIISALSKVDSLTVSMEGRGFGVHKRRGYLKESKMDAKDMLMFAMGVALVAAIWLY